MKRKSGWDEPPPGMENTTAPVPVAAPPLGAPVPQMPTGALPPQILADAAAAASKPSSIQAALEAQKKMLAAKAGGMPMMPSAPVVVAPPMQQALAPEPVDPAITLAIAKAKAAALKTCTGESGPSRGPSAGAIESAKQLLQQSSAAVAAFPQIKPPTMPKGAPVPPLRPGLLCGQTEMSPGAFAGKAMGFPSVVRPPMRAQGALGMPNAKGLPLTASSLQGSTTSKAAAAAGLAAVGATAKQPAAGPTGLGSLAAMKEVSPALAALMQGGLF